MNLTRSVINPAGEIVLHCRKIKPAHVERSSWGDYVLSESIIPLFIQILSWHMSWELSLPVPKLDIPPQIGNVDGEIAMQ